MTHIIKQQGGRFLDAFQIQVHGQLTLTWWNAHCAFPGLLNEELQWDWNQRGRLTKQMTGELPLSSILKGLFETTPSEKAYNSAVHPLPATYNGKGAQPERERKRSRSAQAFIQIQHFRSSFYWEAVRQSEVLMWLLMRNCCCILLFITTRFGEEWVSATSIHAATLWGIFLEESTT